MTRKTRKLLHGALGLAVLSLALAPIRIAADTDEADRVRESVTVFNEITQGGEVVTIPCFAAPRLDCRSF